MILKFISYFSGMKKFLLCVIVSISFFSVSYSLWVTSDLLYALSLQIIQEWEATKWELITIFQWCAKKNKKYKTQCAEVLEKFWVESNLDKLYKILDDTSESISNDKDDETVHSNKKNHTNDSWSNKSNVIDTNSYILYYSDNDTPSLFVLNYLNTTNIDEQLNLITKESYSNSMNQMEMIWVMWKLHINSVSYPLLFVEENGKIEWYWWKTDVVNYFKKREWKFNNNVDWSDYMSIEDKKTDWSMNKIEDNVEQMQDLKKDYVFKNKEKYYYKQLSDYGKRIYEALEVHQDDMKTWKYRLILPAFESSDYSKLSDYYMNAIAAYFNDHPEVWWIDKMKLHLYATTSVADYTPVYSTVYSPNVVPWYVRFTDNAKIYYKNHTYTADEFEQLLQQFYYDSSKGYDNQNTRTTMYIDGNAVDSNSLSKYSYSSNKNFSTVYIDAWKNDSYLKHVNSREDIEKINEQLEKIKDELLKKKTWNLYADIKIIHDFLVDTIEYDDSLKKRDIYEALILHSVVCEWYSRTFQYLLDAFWIQSIRIEWIAKAPHAWNYVNMNGTWYAIDVTWDDPTITCAWSACNYIDINDWRYRYFLKWSDTMSKDHTPKDQYGFSQPILSRSDYKK